LPPFEIMAADLGAEKTPVPFSAHSGDSRTFVTQLKPLQRQIVTWFGLQPRHYGR
jgi:hypothetical protein